MILQGSDQGLQEGREYFPVQATKAPSSFRYGSAGLQVAGPFSGRSGDLEPFPGQSPTDQK